MMPGTMAPLARVMLLTTSVRHAKRLLLRLFFSEVTCAKF
jgi:hypothetical protein